VKSDGTPSDIYRRFRNPTSSGTAAADALRAGYPALFQRNEYWHALSDDELRGLIVEETGQAHDSAIVTMTLATIKGVKRFADFSISSNTISVVEPETPKTPPTMPPFPPQPAQGMGLNLGYTINLNLPPTSDIAVFNAIFKSLKEHLLKGANADE
jgi:Family of unknown function (DUF5343)